MMTSLVLTFSSHDRPGIVSAISKEIAAVGGSWLESRLARLAGEFAGIVLISVEPARAEALTAALRGLEAFGLRVTVERSGAAAPGPSYRIVQLSLVGHDRPGIVRDVTQALSQLGVNIEEFSSGIESAAFTGETMFRAAARLAVPEPVTAAAVQVSLERLADEIMADIVEVGVS